VLRASFGDIASMCRYVRCACDAHVARAKTLAPRPRGCHRRKQCNDKHKRDKFVLCRLATPLDSRSPKQGRFLQTNYIGPLRMPDRRFPPPCKDRGAMSQRRVGRAPNKVYSGDAKALTGRRGLCVASHRGHRSAPGVLPALAGGIHDRQSADYEDRRGEENQYGGFHCDLATAGPTPTARRFLRGSK
jgi:hypothetical protein